MTKLTTKMTIKKWNRNSVNLLRNRITKTTLYVSGWGGQFGGVIPELDVDPTQHLQRTNIKRVHQIECMDIFKTFFHENQHCAYTIPKETTHITLVIIIIFFKSQILRYSFKKMIFIFFFFNRVIVVVLYWLTEKFLELFLLYLKLIMHHLYIQKFIRISIGLMKC